MQEMLPCHQVVSPAPAAGVSGFCHPLTRSLPVQKGALSTAEVCEALGLSQMKNRRWHVQGAVAIRGEGLYEGLDW